MKKYKILFMSLLLALTLSISFNVSAKKGDIYYNDSKSHSFQVTDEIVSEQYGVTYNALTGTTINGPSKKAHIFSMKTDGATSKLVTWAYQEGINKYKRLTVADLAKDYEKNHPGWKVVAGINADQYIMSFGTDTIGKGQDFYEWQPYYPIIMDGERRFPYTMTATSSNAIAFTNNGTSNGFIDVNTVQGLYVEILDENNNVLSKYPVEGVNTSPSANKTTVWFSYVNQSNQYEELNVNSSNDLFIVSNAELAYMSNSRTYTYKGAWAIDSVFGRGKIDQIAKSFTLDKGQFIIDSSDASLISKLNTDVRVRVQYSYANEALNNVEYASGYHSIQRLNGKDMGVSGDYNTFSKSRSVFGIKADGTYVLMTADMTTNKKIAGLTGWEINAFLKQNDVVTAYQDDGGGSVTAIWRNKDGGFDLVNTPRDGGERSNLSGLFFVVKDSGVTVDGVDATSNSLTFKVNTDNADMNKIKHLYCTIDGVTKEVVNNQVTFDGLNKMTEYSYAFSYDTENAKNIDAMVSGTTKTAKTLPTINSLDIKVEDGTIIFNPIFDDPDLALEYIRIIIDGERYPYLDEPIEIEIDTNIKELEYILTYSYDLKDGKEKVVIEENKVLKLEDEEHSDPLDPPTSIDPVDPGKDDQSGCTKDLSLVILSLISLSTTLIFFKKRR